MLRPVLLFALLTTPLAGQVAVASPASVVPGGSNPDEPDAGVAQKSVSVSGEVDYAYDLTRSTIARENVGAGADPLGAVPLVRDLEFQQFRHTITPRLHVGVFRDAWVSAALPIVITQARELNLASGQSRMASPSVVDGLLPAQGYDARDPSTAAPGDLMFRGPNRGGLDQVHVGLGVAPMNQQKDPTKPTWKLGADFRLAIGKVMQFDPTAPEANKAVGRGVHELRLWTSFARKLGRAEPWFELFWTVPVATKSGSLFTDPGYGSSSTMPSQQAGAAFGLELYAVDNPAENTRISLDLGTRVLAHFEGREYTEMWEVFASAGDSRGMGPLILDANPTSAGVQALSHPGISNIENYLETAGRFALRAQIGPHVRFALTADLVWKTDHVISFADAGVDHPTCGAGGPPCEDEVNDLVNPGTDEVNPLHSPTIDLVGHRYVSTDNFDVVIGVQGQVLF